MRIKGQKRTLYIHHGSAHGGAPLSLLSLIRSFDPDSVVPIICAASGDQDVVDLFSKYGFETHSCRLSGFAHTTGGHYPLTRPGGWRRLIKWYSNYGQDCQRLANLIAETKPDIVHFNSLTLAPFARVAFQSAIPSVVHVRESVIDGALGFRKQWLCRQLDLFATKVICICRDNMNRLNIRTDKMEVIYNPVEFDKFDHTIDPIAARKELGVPVEAKVTLFAGGSMASIKGIREYIHAMGIIRETEKQLVCLMPSFQFPPSPRERIWTWRRRVGWVLGVYKHSDSLYALTCRAELNSCILNSDFTHRMNRWIAAADVVCVPHIKPHFSRTVIEAGAMKKPVVAFRIGGVEEVVADEETGLLVEVGDCPGFANAVIRLFKDKALREKLGEGGYEQAKKLCDAKKCAGQVAEIYGKILETIH